ncbi:acyl carrier protein [Desulfovibrio sp. JC010]|uniref:acyl carrier protein n=1 Tax=Desulfovibrio sp. JC010 TaxID=2593641 RepID=UPI0013D0EB4E|nr:acyl carrier protein [Desulfovibrio sp. JC010]NDV27176.1 acyl carrier protein [Desulfovibrio sp. JC010]
MNIAMGLIIVMEKIVSEILANYAELGNSFDNALLFTELAGWDSLKHVQFILDVEKKFEIKMTPEQLVLSTSVDSVVAAIRMHKE